MLAQASVHIAGGNGQTIGVTKPATQIVVQRCLDSDTNRAQARETQRPDVRTHALECIQRDPLVVQRQPLVGGVQRFH
ncbi:MAG: hypothetical protein ACRENP_15695 [Longimicrobiales bacterium]